MNSWFKSAKSLVQEVLHIEKDFRLGISNQKWAQVVLIIWIFSLLAGLTIEYAPKSGTNFLNGFRLSLSDQPSIFITIIALLVYPVCGVGLLICRNKGWIDKDDF